MSIELKEAEIKNILAEVTASLQAAKKSEAEKLSKAIDGEEPSAPAESAPAESEAPAAPEASESAPAASPEMGDAPPAESAPAESAPAESAPVDPAASADPAAEAGPADPAMLAQEYAKLDDEQLKAHYMAAKQAVFERMQGAASAGAPPDAASPSPDASAVASPPAAGASPAMKGEMAADGNVAPVTKPGAQDLDQATGPGANLSGKQSPVSEASHADLKVEKEVAKSEKSDERDQVIEGLVKAVNLLVNGPQIRKAVTSVAFVERSESLAKSEKPAAKKSAPEMKAHLSELIRSGKLNKNEKAAVVSYFETKNPIHLEKIAHLFE